MADTPVGRLPVASSMAKSAGHDPEKNELHVEFNSGKIHIIEGVTAEEAAEALSAPSFGKHYNAVLKGRSSRPFSDIPDPSDQS